MPQFGSADLASGTPTSLISGGAPDTNGDIVSVRLANRNASGAASTITIWWLPNGVNSVANQYVCAVTSLDPLCRDEIALLPLAAGDTVWAQASTSGISAIAYGVRI